MCIFGARVFVYVCVYMCVNVCVCILVHHMDMFIKHGLSSKKEMKNIPVLKYIINFPFNFFFIIFNRTSIQAGGETGIFGGPISIKTLSTLS